MSKPKPFRLKVGYLDIQVVPLREAARKALNCEGYYNPETREIGVRLKTNPAEQIRILLHEIIHCCFDSGGWEDVPLSEEIICNLLDRALTQVHQDNPQLLGIIGRALGPEAVPVFQEPPGPATHPAEPPPAHVGARAANGRDLQPSR